jgi:hypothetical protein
MHIQIKIMIFFNTRAAYLVASVLHPTRFAFGKDALLAGFAFRPVNLVNGNVRGCGVTSTREFEVDPFFQPFDAVLTNNGILTDLLEVTWEETEPAAMSLQKPGEIACTVVLCGGETCRCSPFGRSPPF